MISPRTSTFRPLGVLAFLLASSVLSPRNGLAQEPAEVERAKESFKAGATAYAAGEYLAAIQALDAAYQLTPLPAIAFSLAQAERRQYFVGHERSHLDRAIMLYRRYIDQIPTGGRRADALDALSQLEPLAATLGQSQPPGGRPPSLEGPARPGDETHPVLRPTRLMITVETPGALLSLDGGLPAPSPLIREVEPGPHRVQTSASGFFTDERELMAVPGELIPVAVSLRERPSTISVTTPPEAELYVDGAFVSRGGDHVPLQVPSGSHRLSIAQKGHAVSRQTLTIGPGETLQIPVTLAPTWQRRASRGLFVGGAVALGAGIILSVLTVDAEDRAQEFLRKQSAGNVSSQELSDYHGAVADRGRFRVATAVSLGSAAAFLLTGLFLYELDRPDPQELAPRTTASTSTDPPPRTASSSTSSLQLRVAPLLAWQGLGASLRIGY